MRELHNEIAPVAVVMAATNTSSATATTYTAVEDFKHFLFQVFNDAGTMTKIEVVRATDGSGTGLDVIRAHTISLAADKWVAVPVDVREVRSAMEGNGGTNYTHVALRITGGTDTDVYLIKSGANYGEDLGWEDALTLSNKD